MSTVARTETDSMGDIEVTRRAHGRHPPRGAGGDIDGEVISNRTPGRSRS